MAKVFVTRRIPEDALKVLREAPEVAEVRVNPENRVLTRQELEEGVKWCDCLLSQLTDKIDGSLLDLNPGLKIVANYAVGFNNVTVPDATARKVPVSNTPGVLTDTTADLTFALLLACARRIVEADAYMRQGKYESWDPLLLLGSDVHHKTIGIIGFGRIGYAVAQRAKGFDMKILYTDTSDKDYAKDLGATRVDQETLLRESDFVSLHPFLDASSHHMIDEPQLRMMKKNAVILNAARGPVINEKALVQALKEGWIGGAGLDVYENEPAMEPGLAECHNAVIVPHIGSASIETRNAMGMLAVNNILARIRGEPLPSCVNPEVFQ
jgi:lactate dehydrogenase-like 2-hydroxyacid dehydrogenase